MGWYNEKLKNEFINQYGGIISKYMFNVIFKKCAEMESSLEKDCSLFNLEEILDLARSFRSSDSGSLKVKISLLRSYTQFCIDNGMSETGLNHYHEVTPQMCEEAIDKRRMAETYITREEVEEIIAIFDNPRDKYIILAPYEGIYGNELCEILELRKNDLLGENRVRLCTGREVVVSKMLYKIMEESVDEYEATYNNKRYKLQDTDKVYKGFARESYGEVGNTQINKKFGRLKSFVGRKSFGVRMLYVSGFLNEVSKAVDKYENYNDAIPEIRKVIERYGAKYDIHTVRRMYKEAKSVKDF